MIELKFSKLFGDTICFKTCRDLIQIVSRCIWSKKDIVYLRSSYLFQNNPIHNIKKIGQALKTKFNRAVPRFYYRWICYSNSPFLCFLICLSNTFWLVDFLIYVLIITLWANTEIIELIWSQNTVKNLVFIYGILNCKRSYIWKLLISSLSLS